MAQGQKRAMGRPPKTINKRVKVIDSPVPSSPAAATPVPPTPAQLLPFRISDHRPLPTLPEPQGDLSADEYQSIASSAVLLASLERSRARWTQAGIFERYWTKPESGKNARPPPPNNPDAKWMKAKGPCRIRIEPHIFEAEMYVEEKEKIKPVKYMPPAQPYQPYQQRPFQAAHPQQRPQQVGTPHQSPHPQQQNPTYQGPTQHPPFQSNTPNQQSPAPYQAPAHASPAPSSQTQHAAPPSAQTQTPATPQPAASPAPPPKPKGQPDPVISMLAAKASSDPALKVLMKEVATGKASQQQLQLFQRHIDDLTKLLQEKEKAKPATPPVQPQPQPRPYQAPQPPYQQPTYRPPPQQWQPPPPPPALPVILQFLTPGSTEDRFLFPQNSVIEKLSPQHLLVSCIVTRRSKGKEVWQPVTFMVEVAYGREELLNCVHRWVKPVEQVQAHMKEVMARCTRAPEKHLAFQLPQKAFAAEDTEPAAAEFVEEKEKPKKARSNVVFVKTKKKDVEPEKEKPKVVKPKPQVEEKVDVKPIEKAPEPAAAGGRTRRSTRGV